MLTPCRVRQHRRRDHQPASRAQSRPNTSTPDSPEIFSCVSTTSTHGRAIRPWPTTELRQTRRRLIWVPTVCTAVPLARDAGHTGRTALALSFVDVVAWRWRRRRVADCLQSKHRWSGTGHPCTAYRSSASARGTRRALDDRLRARGGRPPGHGIRCPPRSARCTYRSDAPAAEEATICSGHQQTRHLF